MISRYVGNLSLWISTMYVPGASINSFMGGDSPFFLPLTYTTPQGRIASVSRAVVVEVETDPSLKGGASTRNGVDCVSGGDVAMEAGPWGSVVVATLPAAGGVNAGAGA